MLSSRNVSLMTNHLNQRTIINACVWLISCAVVNTVHAADSYVADYSYKVGAKTVQEFGRIHKASSLVQRIDPHGLLEAPPQLTPADVTFWAKVDPEEGNVTTLTIPTYNEYLEKWNYQWSKIHWSKGDKPEDSTWSGSSYWPKTIVQGYNGLLHGVQVTHTKIEGKLQPVVIFYHEGSVKNLGDAVFLVKDSSELNYYELAQEHLSEYKQAFKTHREQLAIKERLQRINTILSEQYRGQTTATRPQLEQKLGISREEIMKLISATKLPVHRNSRFVFYFRIDETKKRIHTLLYENQWAHYKLFE